MKDKNDGIVVILVVLLLAAVVCMFTVPANGQVVKDYGYPGPDTPMPTDESTAYFPYPPPEDPVATITPGLSSGFGHQILIIVADDHGRDNRPLRRSR
jgi:hypothetical protein